MEAFLQNLKKQFRGSIKTDEQTLTQFSHDASMFEIVPEAVVVPLDTADVQALVKSVSLNKSRYPNLSLTARSAGTDMSGGAINDSIIVDFKQNFTKIHSISDKLAHLQPGVYFKDFDIQAKKKGVLMPTYPASRDLCTIGGMVANNAGGEKSIEFGKVEDFVTELEFIFADGSKAIIKPLNKKELDQKLKLKNFEGNVYREVFKIVDKHYDAIKAARPNVSKDSTGYHLWNVWDKESGIFDLTKLIVGSQGTLGFVLDVKMRLTNARANEGLLVVFIKDTTHLGELIKLVVDKKPSRFESFDDNTLLLSIKFMPYFYRVLGLKKFVRLVFSLIPDAILLLHGVPRLVLMISIKGNDPEEIKQKIHDLRLELEAKKKRFKISGFEEAPLERQGEKFWTMRHYSFQILRSTVKDKHTAPFIDDFVVNPEHLPVFLPKLRKIIKKYKLFATIAGHLGDGNFHIIPLMNIERPSERAKILPAMKEVNNLVLSYGGSLSGEHNDGLVRGPWLSSMYSKQIIGLFSEVKTIFDPQNIFNPHKKTDSNWDYSMKHLRQKF